MLSRQESDELRRLIYQAWDLRDTGYYQDALAAIEDWFWALPVSRLDGWSRLDALLKRTDPDFQPFHDSPDNPNVPR